MSEQRVRRAAALFDLDGVLLDSAASVAGALASVATCATGRRYIPATLPDDALLRPRCDVLAELGVTDPDAACDRWWDGALAANPAPAFPGIIAGLEMVRSTGVAVGVVTLQHRHRLEWLLPPDLAALLDVVISRQDAPPKPLPDGVRLALDQLGVRAQSAVMVGDSPTDILAARSAGVLALGVVWGYHPPSVLEAAGARQILNAPGGIGPLLLEHLSRRG